MKFIDEIQIRVASGKGGAGCVSFRREAFYPRGGPDGGDGGRGGDLIFVTSDHLNSLVDFRRGKLYAAGSGQPGGGQQMTGADGEDLILSVPRGTLIRDEQGELLVDLTDVSRFTLLKGGRGGKGNTFFKSSVNQAPSHAQPGEEGQSLSIQLELKLIADVGLLGFPNVGKSTLISHISAARPKIADYPFTTLTPNLGVVSMGEGSSFVVADIPGLVPGAHTGVGLGIQFLKHIERTRVFVHLIDVSGMSGREPLDDLAAINHELESYDRLKTKSEGTLDLSQRRQIIALNKVDNLRTEELDRLLDLFERRLGQRPMAISAVTGQGVKELLQVLSSYVFLNKDKGVEE